MNKYLIECSKCGRENEAFRLTCKDCGAALRNKISNINMWNTFYLLLETPSLALMNIIQSEMKNFAVFLFSVGIIKFSLIKYLFMKSIGISSVSHSFVIIFLILEFIVYFLLIKIIAYFKNYQIRIVDVFSSVSYTFFVEVFALLILLPIEYSFFGSSILSFNPSPFFLKPFTAYFFLALEVILLLITIFYLYLVSVIFIQNKFLSVVLSISFLIVSIFIFYET